DFSFPWGRRKLNPTLNQSRGRPAMPEHDDAVVKRLLASLSVDTDPGGDTGPPSPEVPDRLPPPPEQVSVPGYEVLGRLGAGGMGVVYRARQVALGRQVALKVIRAGVHADASERARFRSEAQTVAALQHPNVVQIFEVGEHHGLPFFSLELLEGGSLEQRLA